MKKLFWIEVNGSWEEVWLDVEPGTGIEQIHGYVRYQPPKPKLSMTNVFLMLLSLAITVLVGLYLYFQ